MSDNKNNEDFNDIDYSKMFNSVFGGLKSSNNPKDGSDNSAAKTGLSGYMSSRQKRSGGKTGNDALGDYDGDDSLELSASEKPTFKNSVGGILFFTIFWCAIVAVFLCVIAFQINRSIYAEKHFKITKGRVLSSGVESHSSDDGTTYSPNIKYSYTVNGKKYTNDDYELSDSSSSGSWAHNVVRNHPAGKKIDVYYDPADPQDAALTIGIPEFAEIALLFLQPFVLVGLGMIFYTIKSARTYFKEKRNALTIQTNPLESEIPLWCKKPLQTASGFQIISKPKKSIMMALFGGYGLTIFFSLFYFAFAKDFQQPLSESIMAMKVALGVGIVFAFITIILQAKSQGSIFTVDTASGYMSLDAQNTMWELPFNGIDQWYIRKINTNTSVNHKPVIAYLLAAKDKNDIEHPVHLFYSNTGNSAAKRAAVGTLKMMADATKKPMHDRMITRATAENNFDKWKLSQFKDIR